MNFDIMFRLILSLIGASASDEIKRHEVTTDEGKQLTKVVLESTKVRVTIEKLPIDGTMWIGGTRLPNGNITNITGSPNILQWIEGTLKSDPRVTAEDRSRQ